MQDHAPRANHQLPLTRNHLYALGALALSSAVLAFFVGFSLGRAGGTVGAEPVVMTRLVTEEARTGDLEVLLARVEESSGTEMTMGFPAELPRTEVPPPPPVPLAEGETAPPVEPVSAPPAPFPAESRPGAASLGATAGVAPDATGNIPTTGWSIQVSEHASEADALQEVASLSAADMPAYSVVALVEGKVRWRVRIGGYANKDAANAAIPAVVAKAGVPSASATMAP